MTGSTAVRVQSAGTAGSDRGRGIPVWRLAWRNLWRNRRRTWLTAGGIGFAVWMLVFAMSMQQGTFGIMVDNGARLLTGHIQVQHPGFADDPRLEHTLTDAPALMALAAGQSGVTAVLPRAEAFALASVGERSYGARIVGVDPSRERLASSLPALVTEGRYLQGPGDAFVGEALARNLGLAVDDDIVLLGTALEGGVAAHVARVSGLFATGQPAVDRVLVYIPLADFRGAWNLASDEVHVLALMLRRLEDTAQTAAALVGPDRAVLDWTDLMPEAEQSIELKRLGAQLFFALIAVIVTFSVVNTFMMTVYERTPEFGMLMALGMRAGAIRRQLSVEALWMCVLGVALGIGASGLLVGWLGLSGMPLPVDAGEILARYNLPDRMYPAFSVSAAVVAVGVMFIGTQVAVWVCARRIRRLRPVDALRALE